jgi:hypothetical protein
MMGIFKGLHKSPEDSLEILSALEILRGTGRVFQPPRRAPAACTTAAAARCGKFASLAANHLGPMATRLRCGHYVPKSLPGPRSMLQIDPWVKAAECERAIRVVADPERRSVLISLRSLWVALGNEKAIFERSRQSGQVPMIAQIHAELMSLYRNAMH